MAAETADVDFSKIPLEDRVQHKVEIFKLCSRKSSKYGACKLSKKL